MSAHTSNVNQNCLANTSSTQANSDADNAAELQLEELLKELSVAANQQYESKQTADVDAAINQINSAIDLHKKSGKKGNTPFDFEDDVSFTFRNGIFALGNAINGLLGMQPQIIAGEMSISTQLVGSQIEKWSNAWVATLQYWEGMINQDKGDSGKLAVDQGAMSVANAASSASSAGLNGVQSMLTSGTSSKTSTYNSLIQQVSSVVTALLNAMTQNWS